MLPLPKRSPAALRSHVPLRRWARSLAASALLGVGTAVPAVAQIAAFPGAVGFGAATPGGRGGTVYHVSNLNDSGAGSFRDAVSGSHRIVVFDVGGYINLQSAVSAKSYLTIAGQTAPGDGIGIMGAEVSFSNTSNVICRYVRFRQGTNDPESSKSGLNFNDASDEIFDHVSIEFAQYDNVDAVTASTGGRITFQNCLIADPIGQQFDAHCEGGPFTWYNDIFASAHNRCPLAKTNTQYVNNVVYNYQAGYTAGNTGGTFYHDVVNNYFITGPATTSPGNAFYQVNTQPMYARGNFLASNKDGTLSGSLMGQPGGSTRLTAPWSPATASLPTTNAADAYAYDAAFCGALPRDQVDAQVIGEVMSLGKKGKSGGLWTTQVGTGLDNNGYGVIGGGTAPLDSDGDGMPDVWEQQYGLNAGSAADAGGDFDGTGYSNIEKYVNGLVDGSYPLGTPVNLSGRFTTVGITAEGAGTATGLDGKGDSYSGFFLNGSLTTGGATFNLGAPGAANALRTTGQTVLLPSGRSAALTFLGAATGAAQTGQKFLVRYTDGTTDTFTQSFSPWTAPAGYAGEQTAVTMSRRVLGTGAQDGTITSLYRYTLRLNGAKTARSVTLPNNTGIALLAMDLVPTAVLVQPGGTYELIPQNAPALALTVAADGATVDAETLAGAPAQQWTITDAGGGYYRLSPGSAAGNALDVSGTRNSTLVDSAASTGGAGQLWQIIDLGNGTARIAPRLDLDAGLNGALDVVGSHTTSGTGVDVYQIAAGATGGLNEQWRLARVR